MPKIRLRNLAKFFETASGSIDIFNGITTTVEKGEFICVVGPSGCGKTTLLKIIGGLIMPSSGEIIYSEDADNNLKRSAMVFQEHGLFPWMNIIDNAAFGLEMQGAEKKLREDKAKEWLSKYGLAGFEKYYPHQLSGGMRQRIAIARALLCDPQILLMDEPFASLDALTRKVLQQELLRLWKEDNKTIIYITHDIDEAIFLADRILIMSNRPGTIVKEISNPSPRPRTIGFQKDRELLEIRQDIWNILKMEVNSSLKIKA